MEPGADFIESFSIKRFNLGYHKLKSNGVCYGLVFNLKHHIYLFIYGGTLELEHKNKQNKKEIFLKNTLL